MRGRYSFYPGTASAPTLHGRLREYETLMITKQLRTGLGKAANDVGVYHTCVRLQSNTYLEYVYYGSEEIRCAAGRL